MTALAVRLIIGPSGAGKTTLFDLITGEVRPDGGSGTRVSTDGSDFRRQAR